MPFTSHLLANQKTPHTSVAVSGFTQSEAANRTCIRLYLVHRQIPNPLDEFALHNR